MQGILKGYKYKYKYDSMMLLSFTPVLLVRCNLKAETMVVFEREGQGLAGLEYRTACFLERYHTRVPVS